MPTTERYRADIAPVGRSYPSERAMPTTERHRADIAPMGRSYL